MSLSLCFVGGGIRALRGLPDGGSERQVALLAIELARRGHDVSMVVPGLGESVRLRGVGVIPGWPPDSGWPKGVRLWTSRLPFLRGVIRDLEPDVSYTRGFSLFAPAVAGVAQRLGFPYFAALACDDDLVRFPRRGASGLVHRMGYGVLARAAFIGRALRRASLVLAQHDGQLRECSRMKLPCRIIRNAFVPPAVVPGGAERSFDAVWVGHLSVFKGFDRLVEVLERSGGLRIAIAGEIQGSTCEDLLHRALRIPGVEYLGGLSHPDALSLIASSKLLLNTSPAEGFSNTFLEAWFLGRPVVSLVSNPDGLLSGSEALGICGEGDTAALADEMSRLCSDATRRSEMGRRGRERVERHHLLGPVVDSLELAAAEALIRQG